ncbi:MAG: MFS transporter [Actinomycetota bacterium]|nr:MFS transporter [Actinomycetota bacterium]
MSSEPLVASPSTNVSPAGRDARRGLAYLVSFGAAAVGAGLVRTVASTYLPLLLAEIREAPVLIGLVMLINSAAGFAVPLLVGRWSDRRHTPRHGRRPFIVGGSLLTLGGLTAVALGHSTSFLVLTFAGAVAYVGVNVVTTAHRALVHDCFKGSDYARGNGAQEVAMLAGGLVGLAVGGLLTELALWAPFLLAAIGMPLLALPTLRLPIADPGKPLRAASAPLHFYRRILTQPGVRSLLLAEILWVIGYAPLPVFFLLYGRSVLGLEPGVASMWLAAFAVGAGAVMGVASRLREQRRHKRLLALGVACMGLGFLGAAATTSLVGVSLACAAAAVGFGLISTLGFSLFASLIPQGESGGYTALYYSLRAVASAVAVPLAGLAVALTDSYRSIFALGGAATLAALMPLAFAMSPHAAAASTRLLR